MDGQRRATLGDWRAYEERFLGLMAERQIEKRFKPEMFGACLLPKARRIPCHRRLVCEYLNEKRGGALEVHHLNVRWFCPPANPAARS